MNVKIHGASVLGEVDAIPSKSYAHRISICNFLAGKTPTSGCKNFTSKDIEATENCLALLKSGKTVLDCGESGSTLRFLLPLTAALGGEYEFIGHGKLMERPNEELFSVFKNHGVTCQKSDTIKIRGKLSCGEYKIRGDISSQYISGLLMALPTLDGNSKITLTTPLVSAPYVDITLEVLSGFGVKIEKLEDGYYVYGNQKYVGEVYPEGDWSNMAFFMALGAMAGSVTVRGMNLNSVQGDKKILEILQLAGALVTINNKNVTVKKSKLKAFSFNAEDCPDLVPIAAALASRADGVTEIKKVERLKIKESDRIESTIKMLASFGIKAESDGHTLKVFGSENELSVSSSVSAYNDHRIVMSAAVLGATAKVETVITDAQAVNKSYPSFFIDYSSVGGVYSEF